MGECGRGRGAAGAVIVFELRVRALSLRRLIGAVAGSVLGIFGAALFCLVLRSAPLKPGTSAVLQIFVLLLMTYVGLLVGANKGDLLNPAALGTSFPARSPSAAAAPRCWTPASSSTGASPTLPKPALSTA
jgi:hypothetical protein